MNSKISSYLYLGTWLVIAILMGSIWIAHYPINNSFYENLLKFFLSVALYSLAFPLDFLLNYINRIIEEKDIMEKELNTTRQSYYSPFVKKVDIELGQLSCEEPYINIPKENIYEQIKYFEDFFKSKHFNRIDLLERKHIIDDLFKKLDLDNCGGYVVMKSLHNFKIECPIIAAYVLKK